MDKTSFNQTFNERVLEEGQLNLLKQLEKMQNNLHQAEKSVKLSKDVLSECDSKLEVLSCQVKGLKSAVEEVFSNVKQQSTGESGDIQGKNRLKRRYYAQEIPLEECEQPRGPSETTFYGIQKKKLKTNPENHDSSTTRNYESLPGPSRENPEVTRNNYSQEIQPLTNTDHTTPGTSCTKNVVENGNYENALSDDEFKTFLHLSDEVEDPILLATSFTNDIQKLFLQLKNYEATEKERSTSSNRDLEIKVQRLMKAFQEGTPDNTENISSQGEHEISEQEITQKTETGNISEDVVETAMRRSKGVLSQDELKTFLYLSDNTEDLVQIASSFTNDLNGLYSQLLSFHFHLKAENNNTERERGASFSNRDLENKTQILIQAFQAVVDNSDPLSSTGAISSLQSPILNFRKRMEMRQHLQRFFNRH